MKNNEKVNIEFELDEENIEDISFSKTKRKRQMEDLQKLGSELISLDKFQLAKLELPDNLIDAIEVAKKIKSYEAIRRHQQYIGKLMRSIDSDLLLQRLKELDSTSIQNVKLLHQVEQWREKILNSDDNVHNFIEQFKVENITAFRTLVRSVRRDIKLQQQSNNLRKLFKFIRKIVQEDNL